MAIGKFRLLTLPRRLRRKFHKSVRHVRYVNFIVKSLFYNQQSTLLVCLLTVLQPVLLVHDFVWKQYGAIFMAGVIFMGVSVNIIYVFVILPDLYEVSPLMVPVYFLFGLWLLVNATFHYFMGAFVGPGYPAVEVENFVAVCKKCFAQKPPRTHHCRVCDRCVLKMDHHCPWLNNCVGFKNHRYFVLFLIYTCIGCLMICCSSSDLFNDAFYGNTLKDYPFPGGLFLLNVLYASYAANPNITLLQQSDAYTRLGLVETFKHQSIVFSFVVTSGVSIALVCLVIATVKMVSHGQTTIEFKMNMSDRNKSKKKKKVLKNPYHYGFKNNWKMLLGIEAGSGRTFWRHVLLPSMHSPRGDGLTWPPVTRSALELL